MSDNDPYLSERKKHSSEHYKVLSPADVHHLAMEEKSLNCEHIIRAQLTPEEWIGFCRGTLLKYALRAGKKGQQIEDIEKARVFTGWLLDALDDEC